MDGKEIGAKPNECYGSSVDTKPLNVLNASTFYEYDTGKLYMFDGDTDTWVEQ